ncbi:MAG: glycoside hydrolase family 16 protein [Bacilli bacterium]
MKKNATIPLLLIFLVSCSNGVTETRKVEIKEDITLLENIDFDFKNTFFDDFSNGVDFSSWYIANHAWGNGNGGVVPENVHYTDNGILYLQGNGKYYSDGDIKGVGDIKDGRYTGAALISKFNVKPGRFEIKMKPLPRQGACTAFWTFAYQFTDDIENKNHEIDIELPGGSQTGIPTFENVLNTNYNTETKKQSYDTNLKNIFDQNIYLNDGNYHVFGFDWYTILKWLFIMLMVKYVQLVMLLFLILNQNYG